MWFKGKRAPKTSDVATKQGKSITGREDRYQNYREALGHPG